MNRHLFLVATLSVCSLLAAPGAALAQSPEPASSRFASWAEGYAKAASAETKAALEPQGVGLAAARRVELSRLIVADPARALALALPARLSRVMPSSIADLLEERLDVVGALEVLALCNRTSGAANAIERTAVVGERRFRGHAYGSSLSLHTRTRVALHGIALGGELALLDARTRRLEEGEAADPMKPVAERGGKVRVDSGDALHFLDEAGALALEARLAAASFLPGPGPSPSPWTTGTKKALYIRVDFSDAPGDPITVAQAQAAMVQVNQFLHANSYTQLTINATVTTQVLRMPQTKASYESSNGYTQLMTDARAAASGAGYAGGTYDFDLIAFRSMPSWGWAGLGYVGAKGLWLNGSFGWSVASHELGHNLGLSHSNFWQAPGETIIGAGTSVEYGNPFDVMGSGDGHFMSWDKSRLGWIPGSDVGVASASNSFRIYDLESTTAGGLHALKVPISGAKDYWVEFRPLGGGVLTNSASINWGTATAGVANLLDMVPSTSTANDAPLAIGRTFADPGANLYITPTGLGGTSPESLDVTVSVGFQAANQPPTVTLGASTLTAAKGQLVTFTASASDPNADPLAYFWDFGDGSASSSQAIQVRSWSTDRDVSARVVVSDMKGGTASGSVVVRVGSPGTRRISGAVNEGAAGATGVDGVKVTTAGRVTFSDSTGAYTLVGLVPGSYAVSGVKAGWTIIPSGFTNPVTVGAADVPNQDFTGSRVTYNIAGKVTSSGVGLAGVSILAGTYSALTNGAGDYVMGGVPNGTYAVTAQLGGRTFKELGFANPVQVNGAGLSGKNFYELVFPVSGEVTGVAGPHTLTDGVRTATTGLSGGKWVYTLVGVPPGNWNLVGATPGMTLTPSSFANPVTVSTAALTGQNFVATSGASYLVKGYIQEGGTPLPGVVVDGGVGFSTTDSLGNFALSGVANGSYTLTPTMPGYVFAPTSRAVTVASSDSLGNDFGVLNANAPPTVLIPARALENPVKGTSVKLEVLGDDDDTEANLSYTWATLFATAPVTFSVNGTNAAKGTQVTFTRAGSYAFEVTIEDLGHLKVKSQVTVLVSQAPTNVTVTPVTASVVLGTTQQFLAALTDQFGDVIDLGDVPAWSVTGGTISSTGLFNATEAGGPFTVSGTLAGVTGTAQATVVVGPVPRIVQPAAADPNPVFGDQSLLTVLGDDDGGEANLIYTWSAVNPPGAVTYSVNGTNAAKQTVATFAAEGSYNVQVTVKDNGGRTVSSYVNVVVKRGLVTLHVSPATGAVVPGGTLQFSASGVDQVGGLVVPTGVVWTTSGGGTVSDSGLYTAGDALGAFTVTGTVGLKSATAQVQIQESVEPPAPPPVKKPGCGCTGTAADGAPFALAALLALFARRRTARLAPAFRGPRRAGACPPPRSKLRSARGGGQAPALRFVIGALLLLAGCTETFNSATAINTSDGGRAGFASSRQPLGEVTGGIPSDQERMLHVLINQTRHSTSTPNGNECGEWSSEYPDVKKPPLVWDHVAGVAARFTSKTMSELGCYQHDSCCVLGDAGAGAIGCVAAGECTGSGCNKTCDAGVGSKPDERFALFGFPSFSGESVTQNQGNAYQAWCWWMQTLGDRHNFYGNHTQVGVGSFQALGTACSGGYWTVGMGNAVVPIPKIPVGSAMYAPPNPPNTSEVYFAASYFDAADAGPKRGVVVVAGHCFDMEKAWGYEDNGTYETHFSDPDVLPEGCHPYYFLFLDADAGRVAYPDVGSLQLPLGLGVSCPLTYDPSPQLAADCETGVQQCPTGATQACYTRDTATLAHGECRQGWQVCKNGFWSACKDMIGPFPEACDGLDNNCDGQIDEGNPGGGGDCQVVGERGECKAGKVQCLSGRLTCIGIKAPQTEMCDGLDNDCDGVVDDGLPMLTCGKGECFRMTASCISGVPQTCVPGTPSPEVADFKDNDCDGIVDNGFDCRRPDGGLASPRQCYSFSTRTADGGVRMPTLPCRPGTQFCQADAGWGGCQGELGPAPEVCDGEDNDCDGQVDENDEIGWDRCGKGQCLVFTAKCAGGTPVTCTPLAPRPEVCNGIDDNCDGTIDEGCNCRLGDQHNCYTAPIFTRDAGVCHPGARLCVNGEFSACQGEVTPSQEWCDSKDNDCDGVVDNACTPLPPDAGPVPDAGPAVEDAGSTEDGGTGEPAKKPGCGCTGAPGAESALALVALVLARRRRGQ